MKIDVLAVCTGNICRSPAVERLLAARTGLVVRSAGTRAAVGSPVSASMASLLDGAGIATQGFAARQLSAEHVESAPLILTASREHRSVVVELDPGALGRTFTLRELVRLLGHLPEARLAEIRSAPTPRSRVRELAAAAKEARAKAALVATDPTADDIVDPIGRPSNVYAEVYRQLNAAVSSLARVLG